VVSFFFSSRRRHTRSKRDWSSDVCSSDLDEVVVLVEPARIDMLDVRAVLLTNDALDVLEVSLNEEVRPVERRHVETKRLPLIARSEERRVGKECRSWRSTYRLKKEFKGNK